MYKKGRQVTVIDQDEEAFDNLSIDFHGRTILGDVLSRSVLRRAEIEHADALAAVTRSDSLNALAAHIARAEYKVARVVARNYDPRQPPPCRRLSRSQWWARPSGGCSASKSCSLMNCCKAFSWTATPISLCTG